MIERFFSQRRLFSGWGYRWLSLLIDSLSMALIFSPSVKNLCYVLAGHRLIHSYLSTGSTSGGTEDTYIRDEFGGEGGCYGQQEEMRVKYLVRYGDERGEVCLAMRRRTRRFCREKRNA